MVIVTPRKSHVEKAKGLIFDNRLTMSLTRLGWRRQLVEFYGRLRQHLAPIGWHGDLWKVGYVGQLQFLVAFQFIWCVCLVFKMHLLRSFSTAFWPWSIEQSTWKLSSVSFCSLLQLGAAHIPIRVSAAPLCKPWAQGNAEVKLKSLATYARRFPEKVNIRGCANRCG